MPILEILKQTMRALWETKLRSFLTMFGIVWGITSVILLVGLGKGFSKDQHDRMKNLGTDIAIIWGGKTGSQAGGYAAGRVIRLNVDDAIAIQQRADLVVHVSPEITRGVPQVSQWNAASRNVRGIWPDYQAFRSLKVEEGGRLISEQDEQNGERVVILGADSKTQLFRSYPAVGQHLAIAGYSYTVIGTIGKKKQNGSYGSGPDNTQLFVPYSAMARDFPPNRPGIDRGYVNDIVIQPVSAARHEDAVDQVRRILAERHHFDPDDKEAIWVWDTLQGAKFLDRIFGVMTIFFGAVALLTLALGGIGVMNIMLVAVTERTREIGVRKALGATASDIKRQFLAESAIITLVSGSIGFLAAVAIIEAINHLPMPDFVPHPIVSPLAIILSLVTLAAITVFAGTYPARRAGSLSPMECLRME